MQPNQASPTAASSDFASVSVSRSLAGDMSAVPRTAGSAAALWGGRIAGGLAVAFLIMDTTMKVLQLAPAVAGTLELGYRESAVLGIGLIELVCLALYLVPRTKVPGAIALTGYLGGAVATHVRVGSPLFSHVLFPIYVALLLWGAVYLCEPRLRALVPLRGQGAVRTGRTPSASAATSSDDRARL